MLKVFTDILMVIKMLKKLWTTHIYVRSRCILNLDNLPFSDVEMFRFTVPQIRKLVKLLILVESVSTPSRHTANSIEAVATVLSRFVYPNRWCDMEIIFHWEAIALSNIFSITVKLMIQKWVSLLNLSVDKLNRLKEDFVIFGSQVFESGSPVSNIAGFLDGKA